ncbi:MAG: hypothetical protein ACP5IT_10655 [Thermoproteota archaeon]
MNNEEKLQEGNVYIIRLGNTLWLKLKDWYIIKFNEKDVQNPEELVKRLLKVASNDGSIVEKAIEASNKNYMRPKVRLNSLELIARLSRDNGNLENGFVPEWLCDIYVSKLHPKALTKFVIFDPNFIMRREENEVYLKLLNAEEVSNYLQANPNESEAVVKKLAKIFSIQNEEGEDLATKVVQKLTSKQLTYEVTDGIKDPSFLRCFVWKKDVVDEILSYKNNQKDQRIIEIQRTHLIRGLDETLSPQIAPHTILATNPGTGKSTFYDFVGINVDQVTARSFLGWAKSSDEVYPGLVDGTSLPINIDEFETDYLYVASKIINILESGHAKVWSAAVEFEVSSTSTFVFSANPIGFAKNAAKSFANLLARLTVNGPALGRRIAFIIYGEDFTPIRTKMDAQEREELSQYVSLFRAVESHAANKIRSVLREAVPWINTPIEGYTEDVNRLLETFSEDTVVYSFLKNHTLAQPKIRAGVLLAVIADFLDKIALGEVTTAELIEEAEDRLPQYIRINLESINNITRAWRKEEFESARFFYCTEAPLYFRVILEGCEFMRRKTPNASEVVVSSIPYIAENGTYISTALAKLKTKNEKRRDHLFEKARSFFGFDFSYRTGELVCTFLQGKFNDIINVSTRTTLPLQKQDNGTNRINGIKEAPEQREQTSNLDEEVKKTKNAIYPVCPIYPIVPLSEKNEASLRLPQKVAHEGVH